MQLHPEHFKELTNNMAATALTLVDLLLVGSLKRDPLRAHAVGILCLRV